MAAGTVAAIASILPRSAMFVGDFHVHKTLLALVSVYLWSAAYYLLHRCLVFLSPVCSYTVASPLPVPPPGRRPPACLCLPLAVSALLWLPLPVKVRAAYCV